MIRVEPSAVSLPDGTVYSNVQMQDFLKRLAEVIAAKPESLQCFTRMKASQAVAASPQSSCSLLVNHIVQHLQHSLLPEHALLVETGDAWFQGQRLRLPAGCRY